MTRQCAWQSRQRERGNCISCGRPRNNGHAHYCEIHRVKHNFTRRLWWGRRGR